MRPKFLMLIALTGLSACGGAAGDPNLRAGTWKIEHNNDTNLQAMVANPADLQHGHGDGLAIGETAANAITRLRTGKVLPLPESGVAELRLMGGGSSAGPGAGQ